VTSPNRIARLFLATGTAVAAAASLAAPVAHANPSAPDVPDRIAVEAGNKVFLVGHAVGVQIYTCNATPAGTSWSPAVPRANLYGDNGELIATHFGGPTWQAKDGSAVVAQRVDGVTMDASAIPWLLLSTVRTTSGHGDRLTETTFIQRTATTGGLAPAATECNDSTAGTKVEVPYTADYHFWKATGA
jgi:Protein of unknown function (DUF3455)